LGTEKCFEGASEVFRIASALRADQPIDFMNGKDKDAKSRLIKLPIE
jgi:hypothetical protein